VTSSSLDLSPDQASALATLLTWLEKPTSPFLSLGGYAGTGKTTLVSILRQELLRTKPDLSVAFCAYTGRASQVLRGYLEEREALGPADSCGTIHALLYSPEFDDGGRLLYWKRSKTVKADLIIVDEASMVTQAIWLDLLGCNKPIIAIGDHGQLPPIEGSFNLMEKPDLTLERIHRQAEKNPIIRLAQQARLEGKIDPGIYGKHIRKLSHSTDEPGEINDLVDELLSDVRDETLVLCGRNKTRVGLNQAIRQKAGREGAEPEAGEKVVCLKNIYDRARMPIYNGMTGIIEHIVPDGEHWYDASITFPEEGRFFEGRVCRTQFHNPSLVDGIPGIPVKEVGNRFDFGYALTVHKAQGSQADTVVLFEERFIKSDENQWKRWLYTAVTRARKNLYIIGQD